jgi:hypothetical protein
MPATIIAPIEEQALRRYMNLEKLLSLLQRKSLHFTQLKRFEDQDEGTVPKALVWTGVGDQPLVPKHICDDPADFFVSCWNNNPQESAVMWSTHAGISGVAVTTTLERLRVALSGAPQNIEIAPLLYVPAQLCCAAASPWTVKRLTFAHENEVRAVFRCPGCCQDGIDVPVADVDALIERVHVSPESEPWIEDVVRDVAEKYGLT